MHTQHIRDKVQAISIQYGNNVVFAMRRRNSEAPGLQHIWKLVHKIKTMSNNLQPH